MSQGTDSRKTALSPAKRALLERRLRGEGEPEAPSRVDDPRLSFGMERLWFLHRLHPDKASYHVYAEYRLSGEIDRDRFTRAWTSLVERHPMLRTIIEGQPAQRRTLEPAAVPCHVVEGVGDLAAFRKEFRLRPFKVQEEPMVRACLLPGSKTTTFLVTLHHLVCDGWSMRLLWSELCELYNGRSLPSLQASYDDFVAYQRERKDSAKTYWQGKLAGVRPTEVWPDYERPRTPVFGCDSVSRVFGVESLQKFATHHKSSLFVVLLSCFKATLTVWTGERDVVVGAPMAGRPQPRFQKLFGFFVNTIILRTSLPDDPTFLEVFESTSKTVFEAQERQEVPMEELVRELAPQRSQNRNPLFSIVFVVEKAGGALAAPEGVQVETVPLEREAQPYDMELRCLDFGDRLEVTLDFDPALYHPDTMRELLEHFEQVVNTAMSRPGIPLSEFAKLTPRLQQSLDQFLEGETRPDIPTTLHQMFEEVATRFAQELALLDLDRNWTFRELNEAANRLAHHLLELGLQQGDVVSLELPRGGPATVAMLAVWKAGGATLPLVPELGETIAELRRTCCGVRFRIGPGLIPWNCSSGSVHDPQLDVAPGQTAVVLHTSQSTGESKAVLCHHHGLAHRIAAGHWLWPYKAGEVSAHRSSLGFVDSITELWSPLLAGSTVGVFPVLTTLKDFGQRLRDLNVTRLLVVPALLEVLLREATLEGSALEMVTSSGEALAPGLVELFRERLPLVKLWNLYGSTEVSGDVTFSTDSSLGRPLVNHKLSVCDQYGLTLAPGAAGELCVKGPGVARGYLGENSFEGFFRSGDRVRLTRRDATLEYCGRLDRRVKVRGIGVDLTAFERTLASYPGVTGCCMKVVEQSLVGFWTGTQECGESFTRWARGQIGHALRPSFHWLESFPQTERGKLDRNLLSVPELETPAEPETDLERDLLELWRLVMTRPELGVEDDFFQSGGHSLLGLSLIDAMESLVGRRLPVGLLFEASTVRAAARMLSQLERVTDLSTLKSGQGSTLLMFPPAGCTLMRYKDIVEGFAEGWDVRGFDYPHQGMERGICALVEDWYEQLMLRQVCGPYFLAGACLGAYFCLELARVLRREGHEVGLVVLLDTRQDYIEMPTRNATYWRDWVIQNLTRPGVYASEVKGFLERRRRARVQPELHQHLVQADYHLEARSKYAPGPVDVPGYILRSEETSKIRDYSEDWREIFTGGLGSEVLPGTTHTGLIRDPEQGHMVAQRLAHVLLEHGFRHPEG